MLGISDISLDFLTHQIIVTALFLLLFLLFSFYLYRRTNPPLPGGVRILLGALRIIAVLALFLSLFEPVLSFRRDYERKPKFTILIDRSTSMNMLEMGKTRQERAESLLTSSSFKVFASDFNINYEYFAADLYAESEPFDTDRTAIGEALTELSKKQAGDPSEYWLLLSDGISNTGIAPAEAASQLKTPVYTIGLAAETSEKDIAITGIDFNRIVFAGRPTTIKASLEWQGMNNERVDVAVRSGDKVLASSTTMLPPGNLKQEIELKFTPERPGQQTFKVAIPGLADEVSQENNGQSFSMTVLKSKMKVLLVSDRLDWEYSFLYRFLANSESIDLSPVVFRGDGSYLVGRFPGSQSELNSFDLIILYDINPQTLKSRRDMFGAFINDRGGSLFVMLGENYLKSPFPRWLDDYLPLINTDRRPGMPLYFQFNGRPMENYLFHPAVRLAESRQGVREAWSQLPHFEELIPTDSVAPNSEILVAADIALGANNPPILAFRNIGGGRVLATTAAPYWHWSFFVYGFGENDREYKMFLDGIVSWLSIKEGYDPIRIIPDKNVFTKGEKIGFDTYVYDLGFRPIPNASGYVALINEQSRDTVFSHLIEIGDGRYRADFDLILPGRYKYVGVVEKDGKTLKEASGQIAVESYSIEEYQRKPDLETLEAVSRLTGGRFFGIDNFDSLYTAVDRRPLSFAKQYEITIWNKTWLLIIFISALGIEWLLRKKFQLV
jgi:hypothetical protein